MVWETGGKRHDIYNDLARPAKSCLDEGEHSLRYHILFSATLYLATVFGVYTLRPSSTDLDERSRASGTRRTVCAFQQIWTLAIIMSLQIYMELNPANGFRTCIH